MKVKIGELAKMTGCQVVTIRYYEKEGLLLEPDRTEANYRLYGEKEIERLHFIRHCRHHGMKLSQIRDLLAFKDNPRTDCGWVNSMIEGHIASVTEQISSLIHLKAHLEGLLHKCSGGKTDQCGILKSLHEAESCPYCEDSRCRAEHTSTPTMPRT
ncbi:MAG: Cd(II)/Pb(II)-responsive transcriptional regulator [Desulfopila sp.]